MYGTGGTMFQIKYLNQFLFVSLFVCAPLVFAAEDKNVVVIKNETSLTTQTQAITAPALAPSPAKQLRDAREKQEIETEDKILKELEKQRLLDEQKRADELFGSQKNTPSITPANNSQAPVQNQKWLFGNRSFFSLGPGVVSFPGVRNINSTEIPGVFFSFGGYGYKGNLIFDFSVYYSRHYLTKRFEHNNTVYDNIREALHQPAVAMSIKVSPLRGQVKPYVGLSGSLVYRKWFLAEKSSGKAIKYHEETYKALKDVGEKTWNQSFDAGLALGADMALGKTLGLNVDIRYHVNLYTENRLVNKFTNIEILDKRDSLITSASLRYYF